MNQLSILNRERFDLGPLRVRIFTTVTYLIYRFTSIGQLAGSDVVMQ